MSPTNKFNLFRVNCLLNDESSKNFNDIILSVVYEVFFENNNESKTIEEVYNFLKKYLMISIEFDVLNELIKSSKAFEYDNLCTPIQIKLKVDKYSEIEDAILKNEIYVHIKRYVDSSSLDSSFEKSIEELLYAATFENINSFSINNLKTILPDVSDKSFSPKEIEVFNDFLEFDDYEKNKAIYNILSRAVEFAILTSGKGIVEISKDLFSDKTFVLDTNIFFRIIGIGGEERSDSTYSLLEKCKEIGIKFQYTSKTRIELNSKLDQIVLYLNTTKSKENIEKLAEISEKNPEIFNDDFIVHYARLKSKKIINSVEQFQRKLLTDFETVLKNLDISLTNDDSIHQGEMAKLSKVLLSRKKEMKIYYSRKASEVDSYNILFVKKIRSQNNYNFSDVKSFYLTSDRSLNSIIATENKSKIPETILPSQLYILCKPYFNSGSESDYEEFVKFIKKRKTGFKHSGVKVIDFLNSAREITSDNEIILESLMVFGNIRYNNTKDKLIIVDGGEVMHYKEVLQKVYDEKISNGNSAISTINSLKEALMVFVNEQFDQSLLLVRIFDAFVTIAIIPLILIILKGFIVDLKIQLLFVVVAELIKFYLSSRFKIFNLILEKVYVFKTRKKRFEYLNINSDFIEIIDFKLIECKKGIWN